MDQASVGTELGFCAWIAFWAQLVVLGGFAVLGAIFASAVWLLGSLGFSWYLRNFGNYDRAYGSLGTLMGFMMWIWLGLMVILFGAELNAEIERVSDD